jgi:hypothetical protein
MDGYAGAQQESKSPSRADIGRIGAGLMPNTLSNPRVHAVLENQKNIIGGLAEAIMNLENRLQPVLMPTPEKDAGSSDRARGHGIADSVAENNETLSYLTNKVIRMTGNLEI